MSKSSLLDVEKYLEALETYNKEKTRQYLGDALDSINETGVKRQIQDKNDIIAIRYNYENEIHKLKDRLSELDKELRNKTNIIAELEDKIIELAKEIEKIKNSNNITFVNL